MASFRYNRSLEVHFPRFGELITTCFYVDTCVFEYRQFDLGGTAFASLLAVVEDGAAMFVGCCPQPMRTVRSAMTTMHRVGGFT
jgi:hypothetical protein